METDAGLGIPELTVIIAGATFLWVISARVFAHSDDVDQSFRSDADQNGAKRRRTSLSVK